MSERPQIIRKMFVYIEDSRGKLLQAAEKIDAETFLGRGKGTSSIRDFLVHLMDTEDYWVGSVIMGERRRKFEPDKYESAAGLKEDWDRIHERTKSYVSALSEQQLEEKKTVNWDGELTFDVETILWQLITHELHHGGQICLLLGQSGHRPPELDIL
jgi:uncharacterized damage-inducible protein DinB